MYDDIVFAMILMKNYSCAYGLEKEMANMLLCHENLWENGINAFHRLKEKLGKSKMRNV